MKLQKNARRLGPFRDLHITMAEYIMAINLVGIPPSRNK